MQLLLVYFPSMFSPMFGAVAKMGHLARARNGKEMEAHISRFSRSLGERDRWMAISGADRDLSVGENGIVSGISGTLQVGTRAGAIERMPLFFQ